MTDQFQKLLHSGTLNPKHITDNDRRAMLALIKKSLKHRGGGGEIDASLLRETS
jgi:hypothetical protein